MNVSAKIEGRSVFIEGGVESQGAEVASTDLRAAASLILAGLVATGETRVTKLHHLDRGYVNFHGKLAALGANIERIVDTEVEEVTTTEKIVSA